MADEINPNLFAMPHCPTCGQHTLLGLSPEWLLTHFRGYYGHALAALIQARRQGRGMSADELASLTYDRPGSRGRRREDRHAVVDLINKFQPALIEKGWFVAGPLTTRNGYQLVPFEHIKAMV